MNCSIQSLKDQLAAGGLGKVQFIQQASLVHRHLLDNVGITRRTEEGEIRIAKDGSRSRIGVEEIWLFAPPNNGRVAPTEVMSFGPLHRAKHLDLIHKLETL